MIEIRNDMYGKNKYIDFMLYLFKEFSQEEFPTQLSLPNNSWNDYIEIIYRRKGFDFPKIVYDNNILDIIDIPKTEQNSKKIVLAISGGKDSTTAAAFLKDYHYDVRLFSVKGVNKGFPLENNAVERVANYLELPVFWEKFNYSGTSFEKENIVKNHLILSMMIDYMSKNGIYKSAFGTYIEDNEERTPTNWGLSDMYELYLAFEKAIQSTFPSFKFCCWFKNEAQAIAYLVYHHPLLINQYQSCIIPDRYRSTFVKQIKNKFSMNLLDNRCGRCWKCAQEMMLLHMYGFIQLPEQYINDEICRIFDKYIDRVQSELDQTVINKEGLFDYYLSLQDVYSYKEDPERIIKEIDFNLI